MNIKLSPLNAFRLFVIICLLLSAAALPTSSPQAVQARASYEEETPPPEETPNPTETSLPEETEEPTQEPTVAPEDPTATPEATEEVEPTPTPEDAIVTPVPPSDPSPTEEPPSETDEVDAASLSELEAKERAALVALYNSTNGPSWRVRTNWLSGTISHCDWYGVLCEGEPGSRKVVSLDLFNNNLVGTIPGELGDLVHLKVLKLISNRLSGTIPGSFSNFTVLTDLYLNSNSLVGPIPDLSTLGQLERLDLGINSFNTDLPGWIGSLGNLTYISMDSAYFTGSIPASWGQLKKLSYLWIANNRITGEIPVEIGGITSLTTFYGQNNKFEGPIPSSINNLTKLRTLNLANNQLSGNIPNLTALNFQNLSLSNNQLTSSDLSQFMMMGNPEVIQLANNLITAPIPDPAPNLANLKVHLRTLDLSGNPMTGPMPPAYGELTNLYVLKLNSDNTSNQSPFPDLSKLTQLRRLHLTNFGYWSVLPDWITNLPLIELNVSNNRIFGHIPKEIGNLGPTLTLLDISHNHFWGEIPTSITKLTRLNASGSGGYTNIGHNHLTSKNKTVRDFLNRKQPGWEKTQTPINRVPLILGLNPPSTTPTSNPLKLEVRGRFMMEGAVVYWNGEALPTTFVNDWTLEVTVPGDYIKEEGAAEIRVENPFPTSGQSAAYNFYISNLIPANGSTVLSRRPYFAWPAVENATSYQLQLSTSSSFGTVLMTVTSPTPYLTLTRDLPLNRIVYWRVRAMVDGKYPEWALSTRNQFRSANPPSVPTLATPSNKALTTNYMPKLTWRGGTLQSGTFFEKYEIQIARDANFTEIVLVDYVTRQTTRSYLVNKDPLNPDQQLLEPNTRYFWRVRAYSTVMHVSNWSAARSIRAAILPPELILPVLGETVLTPRPLVSWIQQFEDGTPAPTGFTIQFSLYSNFSELLFSVSPKWDTLSKTPGPGIDTTTLEYTLLRSLPQNRTIHWRVRATGPNGPSLWTRGSFRSANPPARPALSSPSNRRLLIDEDWMPTLRWRVSSLPSGTTFKHYLLEISQEASFPAGKTISYQVEDRRGPFKKLDMPLLPNTLYYWRVKAFNTNEHESIWSPVWSFRMAMRPVENLAISEPLTPRPTFSWDAPVIANNGMIPLPAPTNYTIQFSLSPSFGTLITSGTTNQTSFTPRVDLPRNRTIHWRVRANGAFGPTAWTIGSFQSSNAPSTPSLSSPATNSLVVVTPGATLPVLKWSNSSVPSGTVFSKYELEVATDTAFSSVVLRKDVTTNQYQFNPGELVPNNRYHWRVRAYNEDGHYSTWSAVRNFRAAMIAPVLESPAPGETVLVRRPTFTWASVPGASNYTIQISLSAKFGELLVNRSSDSSEFTSGLLPLNRTIYWRVRANGANGPSPWSEVHSFTIANP
jgi:Leucine-rich repeat (LRR) protein